MLPVIGSTVQEIFSVRVLARNNNKLNDKKLLRDKEEQEEEKGVQHLTIGSDNCKTPNTSKTYISYLQSHVVSLNHNTKSPKLVVRALQSNSVQSSRLVMLQANFSRLHALELLFTDEEQHTYTIMASTQNTFSQNNTVMSFRPEQVERSRWMNLIFEANRFFAYNIVFKEISLRAQCLIRGIYTADSLNELRAHCVPSFKTKIMEPSIKPHFAGPCKSQLSYHSLKNQNSSQCSSDNINNKQPQSLQSQEPFSALPETSNSYAVQKRLRLLSQNDHTRASIAVTRKVIPQRERKYSLYNNVMRSSALENSFNGNTNNNEALQGVQQHGQTQILENKILQKKSQKSPEYQNQYRRKFKSNVPPEFSDCQASPQINLSQHQRRNRLQAYEVPQLRLSKLLPPLAKEAQQFSSSPSQRNTFKSTATSLSRQKQARCIRQSVGGAQKRFYESSEGEQSQRKKSFSHSNWFSVDEKEHLQLIKRNDYASDSMANATAQLPFAETKRDARAGATQLYAQKNPNTQENDLKTDSKKTIWGESRHSSLQAMNALFEYRNRQSSRFCEPGAEVGTIQPQQLIEREISRAIGESLRPYTPPFYLNTQIALSQDLEEQ